MGKGEKNQKTEGQQFGIGTVLLSKDRVERNERLGR